MAHRSPPKLRRQRLSSINISVSAIEISDRTIGPQGIPLKSLCRTLWKVSRSSRDEVLRNPTRENCNGGRYSPEAHIRRGVPHDQFRPDSYDLSPAHQPSPLRPAAEFPNGKDENE